MQRAVICSSHPEKFIDQLSNYSIMIMDPDAVKARRNYLLEHSDYSLLITDTGEQYRNGQDYPDERVLWYTSGTTGDSKFCSFTQTQLDNMAQRICNSYDITANDRYVSIMPLWHAHGQGFYWATRQAQCQVNFVKIFAAKTISSYDPTFITAIPNFLKILHKFNFASLRFVRSASTALPVELSAALLDHFQVPIIEAFGMTEAMSHCFTNPLYGKQRPGTIGLPDGVDADIIDGELYIKGPTVCQDSWYNTGDLADQDNEGYYRIIGRSKDQININGIKINPQSIEKQILESFSEVVECIIFGSNKIKCLYVGTCNVDAIRKFLVNLGSHCHPILLQTVSNIPVSPSGKVSRAWLDKQYE